MTLFCASTPEGLPGLVDRPCGGRPERLSEAEQAVLVNHILRGPDPDQGEPSAWTLPDLCREVERRWGVRYHPGHMSKLVRGLGLSRQKARPAHPKVDLEAQAAFAKGGFSARWRPCARRSPASC